MLLNYVRSTRAVLVGAEIVRRSGNPDADTYHLGRYMGEGIAEVSLSPPAGCRVTSGSPRSIPYTVFVRSNDGQTVEVVHSEEVGSFAVALQCGADNVTRRMEFRKQMRQICPDL